MVERKMAERRVGISQRATGGTAPKTKVSPQPTR
jgi:hypothetical protein